MGKHPAITSICILAAIFILLVIAVAVPWTHFVPEAPPPTPL
jgi:hypothetical protein